MRRFPALLVLIPCLLTAEEQKISEQTMASTRPARSWTTVIQTGFADTFQLTLGGMFGKGPAFQNKASVILNNPFRGGDSITVSGTDTFDTPGHSNDWMAGVVYRARVYGRRGHYLTLGGGVERWRFPSVLKGTQDWLTTYNATYVTKVKTVPVTVQSNSWTLLDSSLPKGSLVHTQVWMDHPLVNRDAIQLLLRHGPQHTYSWNFYGTNGNRVVRYAGALVLSWRHHSLEAGYRQQLGLQPRIPDNRYWYVMVSRVF